MCGLYWGVNMFPLALLNAASPPSPPVDPNLVLLMHFDNNFTDESSYNRTFTTANGTPNFITNAKFGSHAYKMSDGVGVYHNIKCSNDVGFDAIALKKEWQIDFWLYLSGAASGDTLILRKNLISNTQTSTGTALAWSVVVRRNINDELQFRYMYDGAGYQSTVTSVSNSITSNTYHHCRIVSNGTQIKFFVNGTSGATHTITGAGISESVYDFFIGVMVGASGGYQSNAVIDELRIKSGYDTFSNFIPPTSAFTS